MQRENSLGDNLRITNASFTKDAHLVAWSTSLYIVLIIFLLYLTWGVAWLELGHQPQPGYEDKPDSINLFVDLLRTATSILAILWFALLPMNILFSLIAGIQRVLQKKISALLFFVVPIIIWSLLYDVFVRDPNKIVEWFFYD
jgi:hypothetical protein